VKKPTPLQEAIRAYLGAYVAARDAKRLIDIGRAATVEQPLKVLWSAQRQTARFDALLELVAAKEALDLIAIYGDDPLFNGGHGRTADLAYAEALKNVRSRYQRGRCTLCNGPARACAIRHAEGKSCA
jgi:hypothetical protein